MVGSGAGAASEALAGRRATVGAGSRNGAGGHEWGWEPVAMAGAGRVAGPWDGDGVELGAPLHPPECSFVLPHSLGTTGIDRWSLSM